MSKFTEEFSREQVNWFYRHMLSEQDKAIKKINSMKGAEKVLTNAQHDELVKMSTFNEELSRFVVILSDVRENSDKHKFALLARKEELEEAFELNDDKKAKDLTAIAIAAINVDLANAEKIKLTLDRPVIKFIMKILERDLHKFRSEIIPKYEKANDADFEDPIFTRKFWENKAIKSKEILEDFKKKLEKGL